MGILDWLRGRGGGDDKDREVTPGGSTVYHYGRDAAPHPPPGFSAEPTGERMEEREAVYEALFGPCANVSHELIPFAPHVDVYVYEPGHEGRDFYTLATGGMSDLPMTVPDGVGPEHRRSEIIFYCREPEDTFIEWLRFLAHFPHNNQTWLGEGHTMPNGQPPQPIYPGSALDTMLLMDTIVSPDDTLGERLRIDGDPVRFLWLVPITTPECDLKLAKGMEALLDVFDRREHPVVFDPTRRSYV